MDECTKYLTEKLEQKLKYFSKSVEGHPKSCPGYYCKLDFLIKLGRLTKNSEYFFQAFELLDIAIKLFPFEPRFVVIKSLLHLETGT